MKIPMIYRLLFLINCLLIMQITYADPDPVWVDVRSLLEYKLDHIKGDVQIPHSQIVDKIQKLYPDKNTQINLYCLSGGRAGKAKIALENAGYKNVQNNGGISDVRKLRNLDK